MYLQLWKHGRVSPVNVLTDIGVVSKKGYSDWMNGDVAYLETVCDGNLGRYDFIVKEIALFAREKKLKPACCYKPGRDAKVNSGSCISRNKDIERVCARYYYLKECVQNAGREND
jgi:hypothetical protein